jgi:NitT/TauT family transport system permease protein
MVGMIVGVAVGLGLAIVMQRFVTAERGFLPFVIVSQTVPSWRWRRSSWAGAGGCRCSAWTGDRGCRCSVIAAYLAFFPVAVGGLRGLHSPRPSRSS